MGKKKFTWVDGMLVIGLALIVGGLAMAIRVNKSEEMVSKIEEGNVMVEEKQSKILIDISGEVVKPGVYEMNNGDRVIEVLKKCEGLSVNADRDWVEKNLNRARLLKDGEKIYIPKVSEKFNDVQKEKVLGDQSGLVNINTASLVELDKLPGVGPGIGQKIINYREEKGGFVNIEEIKLVSGIGDKLFLEIKDLIKI